MGEEEGKGIDFALFLLRTKTTNSRIKQTAAIRNLFSDMKDVTPSTGDEADGDSGTGAGMGATIVVKVVVACIGTSVLVGLAGGDDDAACRGGTDPIVNSKASPIAMSNCFIVSRIVITLPRYADGITSVRSSRR